MTAGAALRQPRATRVGFVLALLAGAVPLCVGFSMPPSPTVFNHAAAFFLWGLCLAWWSAQQGSPAAGALCADRASARSLWPAYVALAVMALAVLRAVVWQAYPTSLGLQALATLAAAAAVLLAGLRVPAALLGVACGLVIAAVFNVLLGAVQMFSPELLDGRWFPHSVTAGRATGSLRQANHFAVVLVLGIAALVWLAQHKLLQSRTRLTLVSVAGAAFTWGLVASGSRTGALGLGLLVLWGLVDRQLTKPYRYALVLAPVVYGAWWALMFAWSRSQQAEFVGAQRIATTATDWSGARLELWKNTLTMIAEYPWLGVGWGQFNLAWTLKPFSHRAAFFNHGHNAPLHWAAELGLPASLVLCALCGVLFWRVCRQSLGRSDSALRSRFCLIALLIFGVHSMLELPLWYPHMLLLFCFLLGAGLSAGVPGDASASFQKPKNNRLFVAGLFLIVASLLMVLDYRRVAAVYQPMPNDMAIATDRIRRGYGSIFYSHEMDYVLATNPVFASPETRYAALRRTRYRLVDARLLRAWATLEHERGASDRARFLAHRLREFRPAQWGGFFDGCDAAPTDIIAPFACQPDVALTYEEMLSPSVARP